MATWEGTHRCLRRQTDDTLKNKNIEKSNHFQENDIYQLTLLNILNI